MPENNSNEIAPEQSTAWIEFGGVVHCMSFSDLATFKTAANCYSLFEKGPVEYVSSKDPSFGEYVPFLPRFGKFTTLEQSKREDLAEAFNRIARAMVEMETLNDEADKS